MQLRRVVVTGLGALTPIGNDVPSFFKGLQAGTSGAGLITRFDTEKFKVKFACEVKNFNAEDFFDRKEARKMDPFTNFVVFFNATTIIFVIFYIFSSCVFSQYKKQ